MTKSAVLCRKVIIADSFIRKALGLMFISKKQFQNKSLLFIFDIEKNLNFHTFFMNFAIDFLFLDKNQRVTRILKNVSPWQINVCGHGKYVIELPAGKSLNTAIGDTISFK